jgi:hypothetical protein
MRRLVLVSAARGAGANQGLSSKVFAAMAAIALTTGLPMARAADLREIKVDSAGSAEVQRAAGSIERLGMRVSSLQAGATVSEVEQVLGRPTFTTTSDVASGDNRVLVYADEPVRTEVTVSLGRVTGIRLDLVSIDKSLLPAAARTAVPLMTRGGLLAVLGKPSKVETWTASGLQIEQMSFAQSKEPVFSVFLADGLVVDAKPGVERPADIGRVVLPTAISDATVETDLRIGMTPDAAAAALGSRASTATSSFKGQQVLYNNYTGDDGHGLVSLTFIGGVLTAFSLWPPDAAVDSADTIYIAR